MRLMNSRLCLDCEEVHDQQHCPICGSESFAFLTRWVTPSDTVAAAEPAPRATRPPDAVDRREQVDAYRQILNPTPTPPTRGRLVAQRRTRAGAPRRGADHLARRAGTAARPQARATAEILELTRRHVTRHETCRHGECQTSGMTLVIRR